MIVAILSDIHANLEAFAAVIEDMDKKTPDTVICLGDLIGYGPNPEEVIQLFLQKGYFSILGNHEAALFDSNMRRWFNFQAKENSIQTEQLLSRESLAFCSGLRNNLHFKNALLVHGFPPDSVLSYLTMISAGELITFFNNAPKNLYFVGHTHELLAVVWDGKQLSRYPLTGEKYQLLDTCKYIINAGSVGQPRDRTNTAKYLLWDTDENSIDSRHVPYDFQTTSRKIIDRGFAGAYAYRLW